MVAALLDPLSLPFPSLRLPFPQVEVIKSAKAKVAEVNKHFDEIAHKSVSEIAQAELQ
jgi:hypothetical protein